MLAACFEIFLSCSYFCCSTRLLFTLFDDDSFVPDYSSSRAFAILYSFVLKTFSYFFFDAIQTLCHGWFSFSSFNFFSVRNNVNSCKFLLLTSWCGVHVEQGMKLVIIIAIIFLAWFFTFHFTGMKKKVFLAFLFLFFFLLQSGSRKYNFPSEWGETIGNEGEKCEKLMLNILLLSTNLREQRILKFLLLKNS